MSRLTDTERAYIAGFLDGDGCIVLQQGKGGKLNVRVQVTNTEWAMIEWLHERLGGTRHQGKRRGANWRALHTWMLHGGPAAALLSEVQPYLVLKVAQAQLAIHAWETRTPTPRANRRYGGVPQDVLDQRAGNVVAMRRLNQKGRREDSA